MNVENVVNQMQKKQLLTIKMKSEREGIIDLKQRSGCNLKVVNQEE